MSSDRELLTYLDTHLVIEQATVMKALIHLPTTAYIHAQALEGLSRVVVVPIGIAIALPSIPRHLVLESGYVVASRGYLHTYPRDLVRSLAYRYRTC